MCYSPSLAFKCGTNENGNTHVKFLPKRFDYSYFDMLSKYGDDLLVLPCGECDDCVLQRKKQWSVRCYCESLFHRENCFLTLTYDDDHCPEKLVKKHLQSFMKSLRNSGVSCRYYACGEYGGLTKRPHYHVVLFGFFPEDIKFHSKTKSGFNLYTSNFLESLWRKGFVTVQEFDPACAAYVAGYVSKKYKSADCFSLMSNRPGLGYLYALDHLEEMYHRGSIVLPNGNVCSIPKYFDKVAEREGFDLSEVKLKRNRQVQSQLYAEMILYHVSTPEQLRQIKVAASKEKFRYSRRGL